MGQNQSAPKSDAAAAEEEEEEEEGAHTEQVTEDKTASSFAVLSVMSDKAEHATAEVNGHCEDQVATEAITIPDEEDATKTEQKDKESENGKPFQEEIPPGEKVDINEKESCDPKDEASPDNTEVDAKQNDINESFRRFFSSIGLKLTVKKGEENAGNAPDALFETSRQDKNRTNDVEHTTDETKGEKDGQNTEMLPAQEICDNDSTTCPTLTENTPEEIQENVVGGNIKTSEASQEIGSENTSTLTTSKKEDDATPEEEPDATSPSSHDEEVVVSPIKKFFSTGIFSGFRKKKKTSNEDNIEKELIDMRKEETVEEPQVGKEEISPDDESGAAEVEQTQNGVKEEKLTSTSTSAQTTDTPEMKDREPPIIITTEAEILSSQEKIKAQGSPLKRLLSGSSLKKLSKKQRSRRSSESRLSDSGEHVSDQLLSSAESAGNHREESPAQPPAEAVEVEEGTWASFKKLVTPKKRVKRPSLAGEDAGSPAEEPKTSEGEQGSDQSSEEVRKRKDSSVSWEAVLCGSGRRRSRKTSDSEEELAHEEKNDNKRDGESREGAESPREISNNASSPRQAESPSEGDGGSTWKSLKKLVTPKRKAKDEEESKDENIQSDSEITKDETNFSIKKLIPRRKKRKSVEKQDQASSDEADREAVSEDEDSDTPAVVPLSEFEAVETEVVTETQAIVESRPEEEEEALVHVPDPLLADDSQLAEAKTVPDDAKALEEHQTTTTTTSNEESDDLTESSKHQQLSDIPEEGVIEDTMATPASVTEEVARDDTIAEDLIEITSEAITAPEPVDVTLTDETEMISAVSQLTESSNTSGDTTPVPAEHDTQETDVFLHQVVETIAAAPTAVLLCLNDQSPEKLVGSVSPQILETSTKDEATIVERHMQSDATGMETGLTAEELDAVDEIAPLAKTESTTEEVDEVVPAATTDAVVTADATEDEVGQADVSQEQQSMKECESANESQPLVELLPEENEAISTEQTSESERIATTEVSVVESKEDETLSPETESQEADSAVAGLEETENENVEQEETPELAKEALITSQAHSDDHSEELAEELIVADELQTTTSEKAAELNSQEIGADVDVVTEAQNVAEEFTHLQAVIASAEEVEGDIPKAETGDIIASVVDNTVEELDAESKVDKVIENATDESRQEDQVEAEDKILEVVEDLQTLTAVHIPAVHEEPSVPQVLEKVNVTDIPEPCTDQASSSVAVAPILEVQITEVCAEGEKEDELSVSEALVASVQHAQAAEVTTCGLKEGVAAMADAAVEQTPEMTEPWIETVTNEVEIKETTETVTPIMEMTERSETAEGSMVALTLVPTVKVEDNHRIQVQVVDVDIKSAEVVVDTVLEVGLQQAKEIICDCRHLDTDVKDLPPTSENEKESTTSDATSVMAAIPETEMDQVSEMVEPLVEVVACGLEFKEAAETATPLAKMINVEAAAETGDTVVMKHVASVQFEDGHRIQVQVVDVGIKSAEVALEKALEVGLKQDKQIVDVCHEMDDAVENLFAIVETEEEVVSEESKVTIQEVVQQVKESLPEILPDSVAIQPSVQDEFINPEQEIIEPAISETQESQVAESELAVVEHQDVKDDATGTVEEIQVEDASISGDNDIILAEQEQPCDHPEKINIPVSSEIPDKETEPTESKVGVSTEEVPVKKMSDADIVEAQQPQNVQSQIATKDHSGVMVPSNTGLISSVGNVESPSSLSLEFKLNIQFGHAKAPVSSSPHQAPVPGPVEPEPQATAPQRAEVQKQTEQTATAVWVTQTTEPEIKHDAQERAVTTSSPVLMEVGVQAVEAVEPAEQIEVEAKLTQSDEATEAESPRAPDPELLAENEAEEPVQQTMEELEQDVWIDAEENINGKDEKEMVEHLENHTESATCDHEWKTAEGDQEEKTEGDDFADASEHHDAAAESDSNI